MHWPWQSPESHQSPISDSLIERARYERERAQAVIEFFLPEIDPNDTFTPVAQPGGQEDAAWTICGD